VRRVLGPPTFALGLPRESSDRHRSPYRLAVELRLGTALMQVPNLLAVERCAAVCGRSGWCSLLRSRMPAGRQKSESTGVDDASTRDAAQGGGDDGARAGRDLLGSQSVAAPPALLARGLCAATAAAASRAPGGSRNDPRARSQDGKYCAKVHANAGIQWVVGDVNLCGVEQRATPTTQADCHATVPSSLNSVVERERHRPRCLRRQRTQRRARRAGHPCEPGSTHSATTRSNTQPDTRPGA
jgi:hypothetical protein